jgi:hypothetical protein
MECGKHISECVSFIHNGIACKECLERFNTAESKRIQEWIKQRSLHCNCCGDMLPSDSIGRLHCKECELNTGYNGNVKYNAPGVPSDCVYDPK